MSESEKDKHGTDKSKKKPEQKNKGFFAALYGGVGLMLTLAVVIGYQAFVFESERQNENPRLADVPTANAENGQPVGSSFENPGNYGYLTPEDRGEKSQIGEPMLESAPDDTAKAQPKATATPAPTATATPAPDAVVPSQAPAAAQTAGNAEELTDDAANGQETQPVSGTGITDEAPADTGADGAYGGYAAEDDEDDGISVYPAFRMFEDSARMAWPLTGELVMPFSMDHVVYDKTLDQYRTNDSISIAAAEGTAVRAAAEGLVASITTTRENGKTVVVDHGNGWRTTYCQLRDDVPVSVGSVVAQGEVLGSVGAPSLYSVLLGPHLEFSVARSGAMLNPLDMLAQE